MPSDYYETLGVDKTADAREIKRAYRKLAGEHHPDKGGNPEKFKEISKAYETLSDDSKRSQYDQFGSTYEDAAAGGGGNPFAGGGNPFGGGGFNGQRVNVDFGDFGDIFGSFFGGGGSRSRGRQQGADIETTLHITFEEAAFGAKKDLRLRKTVKCETCDGSGAKSASDVETCNQCGGQGRVRVQRDTILGSFAQATTCPTCRGEGQVIKEKCTSCGGSGVEEKEVTLEVTIPAGIDSGQAIRLSDQGQAGEKGTPAGDLYVRIQVEPSPDFEREGSDLFSEVRIGLAQAALGTTVSIKTLDGEADLKIPAGTETGKQFKLKGKGLAELRGSSRGDHYVKAVVVVPDKLSKKAQTLLKEYAEEVGEEVKVGKGKKWF